MVDMHEVVTRARELKSQGATDAELAAFIDSLLPDAAPYDQPRYRCLACRDKGRVEIWHPAEVERFKNGKTQPTCFCMIDCSCKQDSNNRYDPGLHCAVIGWDSLETKRAVLALWVRERERIENHPNYRSEFAEFAAVLLAVLTTFG